MYKCKECGKEFLTEQGLGGHAKIAHPKEWRRRKITHFFQQEEYPVLFCRRCGYAIHDTPVGEQHTGGKCRVCKAPLEKRIIRKTIEVL